MNIHNNPKVHGLSKVARTDLEPAARPASTQRPTATDPGDSVSLSLEGKLLNAVRQAADELPQVRTEKVEALKKAIQEGTYHVSADKIAEAMIRQGRFGV